MNIGSYKQATAQYSEAATDKNCIASPHNIILQPYSIHVASHTIMKKSLPTVIRYCKQLSNAHAWKISRGNGQHEDIGTHVQ